MSQAVISPPSTQPAQEAGRTERIARAPTPVEVGLDRSVSVVTRAVSALTVSLVFFILITMIWDSWPAITENGFSMLVETNWDPVVKDDENAPPPSYGLLPAIVGTIASSVLALLVGTVLGLAIAILLTQDFLPKRFAAVVKNIVDLLAAIPSVVYGLWGLAIVSPLLRPMAETLNHYLGWVPFFSTPLGPGGLAPASLVLAIMVLPTIAAISRDALAAVHPRVKEAAYGLGATRWEVIFGVMLPTASGGIFGAMILGFGRALGETMALAMLIGNTNNLSWSVFAPGNTLAALIANNYKEAPTNLIPRLIFAALVLMLITLVVNVLGTVMLQHAAAVLGGKKK